MVIVILVLRCLLACAVVGAIWGSLGFAFNIEYPTLVQVAIVGAIVALLLTWAINFRS